MTFKPFDTDTFNLVANTLSPQTIPRIFVNYVIMVREEQGLNDCIFVVSLAMLSLW